MVSIIIPTFNERENIKNLLLLISHTFNKKAEDYEVIVIDDHSTDGTWEILQKEKSNFPLKIERKIGKKGKAYSLTQGFQLAKGDILAMIDADLQYPPQMLPHMANGLNQNLDIVVANRKQYKDSIARRILSRGFKTVFGKVLFGLNCDVQSGLKVFKREVWQTIKFTPKSPWTFDLEFLHRAREAGYQIGNVDITFYPRPSGSSNIRKLKTIFELATSAFSLKLTKMAPAYIAPLYSYSMLGAGIGVNRKKYITHTTLHHQRSALLRLVLWQKIALVLILTLLISGLYISPLKTTITLVAVLSAVYFIDVLFNLFLILRSLHFPPEITFSNHELSTINNRQLPVYSILCPLYHEAQVLPRFLQSLEALDWPKNKLDVILLLEEDDYETQDAAKNLDLPSYVKTLIVPHSEPKTKPKATNFGLAYAKGDYVVIYDAEDQPDPNQLKKAYVAFSKLPRNIVCLQAKLNYYNPHDNVLTRLFTAEYSLWFDVVLSGLQSINTVIPLGGTSNHFRRIDLLALGGWDPFNVTEDADLGARLFKQGGRTAIIDSTTGEEANSNFKNWLRQRSRWIKGYMQTYLVHMRDPFSFIATHGLHAFTFQLIVGGKIAFMFINPILWVATISYFAANSLVGPTIESLYPAPVFYMAASSLVFGNFLFLYYYMIGVAKRGHWQLIKYVFLVPFYWIAVSFAATISLYQLIVKPHFWEKTIHGYHLQKAKSDLAKEEKEERKQEQRDLEAAARAERFRRIKALAGSGVATGGALVAASIFANFMNFLYNAYLGRSISVEDFGLVSLVGSFFYLSTVPIGALAKTVTHRSAFLLGKYEIPLKQFWSHIRIRAIVCALLATVIWLAATPWLAVFFKSPSYDPFILFAPVWFIGITAAVDSGFLSGNLKFKVLALLVLVESIIKFLAAFIFVETGNSHFVYAATPIAMAVAFLAGWFFASQIKQDKKITDSQVLNFPRKFFVTSSFAKFSTVAFLSFDLILAKHFLPPQEAGLYALLSLVGKMVFFSGSLFSSFINPLVSREEGAQRKSKGVFYKLFFASIAISFAAYLTVGFFGAYTVPLLLGNRVTPILYLLPAYGLAMFAFSVANSIAIYYQARRKYLLSIVSLFLAFAQILAIYFAHTSLEEIVLVMTAVGIGSLATTIFLHIIYEPLASLGRNLVDFASVFTFRAPKVAANTGSLRILIFNWRDTRHVWAGGAEAYLHEIAKQLIKKGHAVTVFCGNDGKSPRYEVIDGVQIIRRGGFYTVYLWSALYYIFKLRGAFDVIIDSENGIPFFTPLYTRIPIIGLVHHVHQEIHRKHLSFPLSQIALFLEGKLMPHVYKNIKMVTVSNSTKEAMIELGFKSQVEIVHPGVNLNKFRPKAKSPKPSILYLGRLKPYKSIETIIYAMAKITKNVPAATLTIAGEGESRKTLEVLTAKIGLEKFVDFVGRVSENAKSKLLARTWVTVQPSSMEGWGITAIEANASGTPVVAANVPGLRDSVNNPHSGILVPHGDVGKFAQKIELVLTNKKTRRGLEKGARQWAQQFSWKICADNFEQVIKSELAKKNALLLFLPRQVGQHVD